MLVVAGLSLAMMLAFGLRGVAQGKVSYMTMVSVAVPLVILLGLGFGLGDWPQAAIYTLLIMLGLAAVSMLVASVRGLFG